MKLKGIKLRDFPSPGVEINFINCVVECFRVNHEIFDFLSDAKVNKEKSK